MRFPRSASVPAQWEQPAAFPPPKRRRRASRLCGRRSRTVRTAAPKNSWRSYSSAAASGSSRPGRPGRQVRYNPASHCRGCRPSDLQGQRRPSSFGAGGRLQGLPAQTAGTNGRSQRHRPAHFPQQRGRWARQWLPAGAGRRSSGSGSLPAGCALRRRGRCAAPSLDTHFPQQRGRWARQWLPAGAGRRSSGSGSLPAGCALRRRGRCAAPSLDKGTSTHTLRYGRHCGHSGPAFRNRCGDKGRRSPGRPRYHLSASAGRRSPHKDSHNISAYRKTSGFLKLIAIILSAQGKEKVKIFKIPAWQLFFLFTLPQIVGILMKYLCIKYKLLSGAAAVPGKE